MCPKADMIIFQRLGSMIFYVLNRCQELYRIWDLPCLQAHMLIYHGCVSTGRRRETRIRDKKQLLPTIEIAWVSVFTLVLTGNVNSQITHSEGIGYPLQPVFLGFPGGSDSKESACNVGELGLTPGLERSPGGGHGNPLQYSCLENPHGQRSLVGYSPWGRKKSDTTEAT